jgi:hypothetical protein
MNEPRLVDVAFADGHWLAEVTPGFEGQFDLPSLMQLIEAVQQERPDETLLFVVDCSTIEYHLNAEAQLLDASAKSDALVISSEF